MNEEHEFLEAIAEAPEDDAPRLIFADWLEERGELDRAAFIRHQCTAAAARASGDDGAYWDHEARAWQLRRRHGRLWAGAWADWAHSGEFRRGFASTIALGGKCRGPRPTQSAATVRSAYLASIDTGKDEALAHFRRIDWRPGQINALHLGHLNSAEPRIVDALRSPECSRLRSLCLNGQIHHPDNTPELVRHCPGLRDLESLGFALAVNDNPGSPRSARAFAEEFPCLRELDIGVRLTSSRPDFRALASRPRDGTSPVLLDRLTALDVRGISILLPDLLRPGYAPRLTRLRATAGPSLPQAPPSLEHLENLADISIDLRSSRLTRDEVAFLAPELISRLETLPALERLTLCGPLDDRSLGLLARSCFPRLRALHLYSTSISSLGPLRRAGWLPNIRELVVEGEAGAYTRGRDWDFGHLLDSDALSGLNYLQLWGLSLSGGEVESLVRSPAFQGLRILCLQRAGLTPSAARHLARSEAFPELALLDLIGNGLPRDTKAALRRQYGMALRIAAEAEEEWWTYPPYESRPLAGEARESGIGQPYPRD